jgi:hypothetical protein
VFNALKPIAKTANQYVIKGDGVASIDITNVGIRLNKVSTSQYHLHFEPLRFTAKANPPQGYFAIADFSNALVQLYSDSRSQNFANEALMYIADETNGTYAISSCYIVNKVLSIRGNFPFNQSFSFIEGHSYAVIGDIDLWLA